jgi:REP element-mobilizing transposase RayT
VCIKNRACLFGEIKNGKMELSDTGKIVFEEWNLSFEIQTELICDCFVIMPNHIHAIVAINHGHSGSRGPLGPRGP